MDTAQKKIKTGGRVKGTPNRKTQSLFEMCEELNFNPFKAMLNIAKDPMHEHQASMLKEVAKYLYPQRKSLEHSGNISPELLDATEKIDQFSDQEKIKILEEQLKALKNGP